MGVYATFQDVVDAGYGMDIPVEATAAVEALIGKAELRLLARVPTIPARILDGTLDTDLVRGAVEDIVLRVIRNPNGYSSEQAGEFSYRIDRAVASGRIEITPDDVQDLLPVSRARGIGSFRVGVPSWRLP